MATKDQKLIKAAKLSESYLSMGLGLLVVIIAGILIFNFLKGRGAQLTLPGLQAPETAEEIVEEKPSLPTKHTVAEGESLWSIALTYYDSGYNWVTLVKANNLVNPDYLEVGQELTIPEAEKIQPPIQPTPTVDPAITGESYTVTKSDNLWKIAVRAYGDGYRWVEIARENNLVNPDVIHPGTVLRLPR